MHSQNPGIQKIIDRIKYKRSSTLLNYFKSSISFDFFGFSGNAGADYFVIWKYSRLTGAFFAVIYGKLLSSGKNESISLKARMNPMGRITAGIIFLFLSFGWFMGSPAHYTSLFRFILSGILFIGCFMISIYWIYARNKKRILEEVKEILAGYIG